MNIPSVKGLPAEWGRIIERCAIWNGTGRRPYPNRLIDSLAWDDEDRERLWHAFNAMAEEGLIVRFDGRGCLVNRKAIAARA